MLKIIFVAAGVSFSPAALTHVSAGQFKDICSNVGETCLDGTINGGSAPDTGLTIYTTPLDAPTKLTWNDGSQWWNLATMGTSLTNGKRNTARVANAFASELSLNAAAYCRTLEAHGHADWYLPALQELNVLFNNKSDIGGFTLEPGSRYWSSTEYSNVFAWARDFSNGIQNGALKNQKLHIRCVRR